MQFSETRYIRIDGSAIELLVNTDKEARVALKELRHKKREYQHFKRKLKAAIKQATAKARKRSRRKTHPAFASPLAFVGHSLYEVGAFVQGLVAGGTADLSAATTLELEEQLLAADETLLHLEDAILHVQGKLI